MPRRKMERRDITNEVIAVLESTGFTIKNTRQINLGVTQIRLNNGCVINCYGTGRFHIQGKCQEAPRRILQDAMPEITMTTKELRLFKDRMKQEHSEDNEEVDNP